ncbi:putative glycerophosphocholine phosphodiesterase GPCPD1 homolog 2 [Haliotis asinina]|uniref:putative glycerophosphocholine phosphodiesterase GPCPD1 homolog 2 n=1 Tax=Haliotis asinina TaxID=109174 RepID=UPI00353204EC
MTVATFFAVSAATEEGEVVYVTGNTSSLGNWMPEEGVPLEKHEDESNTWSRVINLPGDADYLYRYYICRFLDAGNGQLKLIVVRWETNLHPRTINTKNSQCERRDISEFGQFGGYNNWSRGWLMGQVSTEIRLFNNPIYMWKQRHRAQTYRVKCVPMDYAMRDPSMPDVYDADEEESRDGPPPCKKTEITCFSVADDAPQRQRQDEFGLIYKPDDYLVFSSQTFTPENLGYQLDFYVEMENRLPQYVGYAYILPLNNLSESLGCRKIPINGLKHKPIGEVTVHYLTIKPYKHHTFGMEISYQKHWKRTGRSLDVGHRGMGASYKKVALVRENTVASLKAAGQHGADYVEFDVMLSKDLQPVVYHDFSVALQHRKRHHDMEELLEIPVKDLTCEQLQSLRLYHASSSAENQIKLTLDSSDSDDLQPFPTLQDCLKRVPPEVGFNIEIKHPQATESGPELEHYFDHNLHVDTILKTIFEHAGTRCIIFSSFDPDSCIMLQMKQNKYPVLFLSNGPTLKYSPYTDYRAREFDAGIKFALAYGLLGVDFQAEGLLKDLSLIKKTHSMGLVMFVWGDENNSSETINLLRKEGVEGIIYDRIDFYKADKGQQFVLGDNSSTSVLTDLEELSQ